MLLAGIDEAGYGPTLGPLVIGAVVLKVPEGVRAHQGPPSAVFGSRLVTVGDPWRRSSLWRRLSDAVARVGCREADKILVDDSKAIYSPNRGLRRLEETALCFVNSFSVTRHSSNKWSLRGLLKDSEWSGLEELEDYPWYKGRDIPIPVASEGEKIEILTEALLDALRAADIRICRMTAMPVLVSEFNREVSRLDNKAFVLFNKTAEIIRRLLETVDGGQSTADHLEILIDKQGGRARYGGLLAEAFPWAKIRVKKETRAISTYELCRLSAVRCRPLWKANISFIKQGDAKEFPVALASILAKYVRELFMLLFNQYWQGLACGDVRIKPTAGYALDARRFLKEIAPFITAEKIDKEILIRQR